jgi:large subunit ribosomal protein L15
MLRLNNISPNKGSKTTKKRLGRGAGSGLGMTSGKGDKGQLARSGGTVRPGFEGGQSPLYRRLPKRGFKNIGAREEAVLNLGDLERFAPTTRVINPETVRELGLVKGEFDRLVILSNGDISMPFTVAAHRVSAQARAKLEASGSKIELIAIPGAAQHTIRRKKR